VRAPCRTMTSPRAFSASSQVRLGNSSSSMPTRCGWVRARP
jgi:hypothetical protein